MDIKISAVVNTLNEEKNIEACLQSLAGHVEEILVADMYSTDRTVELASRYTDRIIFVAPTQVVEQARAESVGRASHSWVLVLDADERVDPLLFRHLRAAVSEDGVCAVSIAIINYWFGQLATGRGFPHERRTRFFRRDSIRFEKQVHRWGEIEGRIVELPESPTTAILHCAHPTISSFITKLNRYTDCEARAAAALGWKPSPRRFILRPAKMFCLHYFIYGGCRSGWMGLVISSLIAFYWVVVAAKLWRYRSILPSKEDEPL